MLFTSAEKLNLVGLCNIGHGKVFSAEPIGAVATVGLATEAAFQVVRFREN